MDRKRILIVEDELIAAEYLKETLEENGYDVVDIVTSGAEAIETARTLSPDLILMDIMLSDSISGSEAAVAISGFSDAAIVFLSAHADEEMVDYAVSAKAAGYLMKPYNEQQIVATLRLVLERRPSSEENTKADQHDEIIRLKNGYEFHPCIGRVLLDGSEIELGPRALKLIELLCRHVNVSISNEQIAMHVYGESINERTLRSLVHRIRHTVGNDLIKNVNGVGYMIVSAD